ncbi:3'-5' exonuclease domain-containing protein [Dictyostelium discoideum AX4]|uniref:3'-5' exonuclease domain-containing protein n=1 Tax=Dictyostelium discoideum TaxID=44689 RepID=Q54YU5_DICDI|nr:3'-5' exonuclease domain-containing protein [Dictyostelium discoideum AX4]EAL68469.2 3'-5' exonuclease domain-containing protein [Dictyostelium discoideum AX4]|eukprot:XP_642107.2 3'-5' exonuclease domain-containing protein [Dictyostelium discoideum AX4]
MRTISQKLILFLSKNQKLKYFFNTSILLLVFYWIYKNVLIKKNKNKNNNHDDHVNQKIQNIQENQKTTTQNIQNKRNEDTTTTKNYFKLSNDIKIHVLSTPEECDLILNEFYQSLLLKMVDDKNSPPMIDGADGVIINQQQTTTELLLFPNCNEINNDGLDFIIGFDAEWGNPNSIFDDKIDDKTTKTHYNHKVALIQLSSKNETFLIQVSQMEKIPISLEQILTDPRLIKVGVAVSQDAATIFQTFSVVTKGYVDLVPIARLTNYEGNGLASLALNVMNVTLNKSNKIRCGHWENKKLSNDQIHYAAADAWVGREIFEIMFNTYKNSKTDPNDKKDLVYTLCRQFTGASFKSINKLKNRENNNNGNNNDNTNNKPIKENMLKKTVPDKRVLYDNCLMYSPDDVLLSSISKKKVEWYVSRQLADIIKEEPLSIKLKFQPHGEGHSGDQFYLASKENICVVCGSTHKILRHSMVPHCYRQYLPEEIKSHSSHDVILVCCDCHAILDKKNQIMKMIISQQYNVPIDNENKQFITDHTLLKITQIASIVKNNFYSTGNNNNISEDNLIKGNKKCKKNIPDEKLEEMKKIVMEYIGKEEINVEDLDEILKLNPKQKNENYIPHEKKVIDKVLAMGEKGIFEFIRSWRKNFVESVQPKFLPEHWSIDKVVCCDNGHRKPKDQRQKQIQNQE